MKNFENPQNFHNLLLTFGLGPTSGDLVEDLDLYWIFLWLWSFSTKSHSPVTDMHCLSEEAMIDTQKNSIQKLNFSKNDNEERFMNIALTRDKFIFVQIL